METVKKSKILMYNVNNRKAYHKKGRSGIGEEKGIE